jgi:dipeptidase E
MGTVILSSSGFRTPQLQKYLLELLPKPPQQLRVVHIITASKVSPDKSFVDRERVVLRDLGFQVEEVDIEGRSSGDLTKILVGRDIVYIQGGNTFYLLKHVRESGFDIVIKDLIKKGVIYIGVSAGSYIACPTIEMATWKSSSDDHFGVANLTGMSLVPFLVCVHYNREKYREGLQEGIKMSKYPVRILTDEQALLIADGKVKLIGTGEEIKIPLR